METQHDPNELSAGYAASVRPPLLKARAAIADGCPEAAVPLLAEAAETALQGLTDDSDMQRLLNALAVLADALDAATQPAIVPSVIKFSVN